MADSKHSAFIDALGAHRVVPGVAPDGPLPVPAVLGTRAWFDRRRAALVSTGGRPTDPSWTLKRQVAFSEQTWRELNELATRLSDQRRRVGPGQLAACLLEDVVGQVAHPEQSPAAKRPAARASESIVAAALPPIDPEFDGWEMPALFAGTVAA